MPLSTTSQGSPAASTRRLLPQPVERRGELGDLPLEELGVRAAGGQRRRPGTGRGWRVPGPGPGCRSTRSTRGSRRHVASPGHPPRSRPRDRPPRAAVLRNAAPDPSPDYASSHDARRRRPDPSRRSAASSPRSPARAPWSGSTARRPHVADGVGTTLPVFVEAAGGGVHRRRRRQLPDRPRVRHRGDQRRQRGARRWSAGQEQVAAFTHTCFMVTPYDGYVDVCAALAELTPGDHAEEVGAVQLRRRGGRERRQDRPRRHRPGRGGGLRPRLPRPHQPDDGDDRQEHALQARLRPVRRRGLPGADVLPVPRTGCPARRPRRGRST